MSILRDNNVSNLEVKDGMLMKGTLTTRTLRACEIMADTIRTNEISGDIMFDGEVITVINTPTYQLVSNSNLIDDADLTTGFVYSRATTNGVVDTSRGLILNLPYPVRRAIVRVFVGSDTDNALGDVIAQIVDSSAAPEPFPGTSVGMLNVPANTAVYGNLEYVLDQPLPAHTEFQVRLAHNISPTFNVDIMMVVLVETV